MAFCPACGLLLGHLPDGLQAADRAIAVAAELGHDPPALALVWRGSIRSCSGDPGWRDDGLRGLALAKRGTDSRATAVAYNEVSTNVYSWDGPAAGAAMAAEGLAFARQRGLAGVARVLQGNRAGSLGDLGQLAEALVEAEANLEHVPLDDRALLPGLIAQVAQVHLRTGRLPEAVQGAERVETLLPTVSDPWDGDSLLVASRIRLATGAHAQARVLLRRTLEFREPTGLYLRDGVPIAVATGELDLARTILEWPRFHDPFTDTNWLTGRAHVAEAEGRLADAADDYREAAGRRRAGGWRVDEGLALFGLARCLVGMGRHDDALEPLGRAEAMFTEMGALGILTELEPLRARVGAGGP